MKTDSRTRTEHKRYYASERPKHLKSLVLASAPGVEILGQQALLTHWLQHTPF